ncbi:hypothetical protein M9458_053597, partial [Cirrhinus mrigala]
LQILTVCLPSGGPAATRRPHIHREEALDCGNLSANALKQRISAVQGRFHRRCTRICTNAERKHNTAASSSCSKTRRNPARKHEKQWCKRSSRVFPNDIKRKPPRSVYRQTQQACEITLACYRETLGG